MNILHVIPGIAPCYGGPSLAVIAMCRALEQRGITVMIASSNADGAGVLDVAVGRPTHYLGLPAIFFPRYGEGFKYSPRLAAWLRVSVRQFDAVHIHAVFSHSSVAAARACRRHGVPYVVRPLGSLQPWAVRQKSLKKRALLWTAAGAMLRHAGAIHYTLDEERRRAAAVFPSDRAVVVPLGIEAAAAAPPIDGRDPIVVALSRLHPVKNLELLIDGFAECVDAGGASGWTLVIAGSGDDVYAGRLRALAASRRIADRVVFAGWAGPAEKQALLSRASLFAVPSHSESFGLGLLEAMSFGVPAIVARTINLSADIEAAGAGWVADATPGEYGRALAQAMGQPDDRGRRALAARALSQRFTWETVAASLEALYASLPHDRNVGAAPAHAVANARPRERSL